VLGPFDHIGSALAYLVTSRRQHTSDMLTVRQHGAPLKLPAGLELTWLGTAGFRLAYQGTVIWIDPYVTRMSFVDLVRRKVVHPSSEAIGRWIDKADAVLVGHTHFDHAMDVPAIAKRFGCKVYGSSSLQHLMKLHELEDRTIVVEPHKDYEVGPFKFHFVPSQHSKLQLGFRVPASGELTCDHVDHLTPQAYRCGQVWGIWIEVAGIKLYHQGSADFVEDALKDRGVDIFLCGIAGRRFTPKYVERIVTKLAPNVIVPTHFDDFFRPLDAKVQFSFNVNLTGFADEVHTASKDIPIHVLELGVTCRSTG
jgi:L-ascorbate metabolism protein UlaG (beta-lactamase superfamily)